MTTANLWNLLNFRDDIEEFTPRPLDQSLVAAYEADIDAAIRIHGPAFVPVWNNYRDTGTYTGPSLSSGPTMYDGVRTYLQHYFRRGCQDPDYLTWAYAVANVQWRQLERDGPGQPNFYRPNTFLFYLDGLTTLYKLDPNFSGGGADDGYWTANGEAKTIPEVFDLLVQNCQYGESTPDSLIDFETDRLSRELALTVSYYLNSLRVGNTLPSTSRFDDLVQAMKNHARIWVSDGPTLFGVNSIDYARFYNTEGGPSTTGQPACGNLSSWMDLGITAQYMLRTYNEHPSYANDRELVDWVERLCGWFSEYGREVEFPGTYWSRAVECRDCATVQPDDFVTEYCQQSFPGRDCWSLVIPWSRNPASLGDKQYQITTPMCWLPYGALALMRPAAKHTEELSWSFNTMNAIHETKFTFNGKQLNQGCWGFYDLLRAMESPNIYSTYSHGALPCT